MGKQRRKARPEPEVPESYERMAQRLVDRGLASPLILDRPRTGLLRHRDIDALRKDVA